MTEPTDQGGTPPPDPTEPTPSGDPEDPREALFTGALESAQRVVNAAEAVRLQVMLAGFEAMLLEEQEANGCSMSVDAPVIRAFFLHQADLRRTSRNQIETALHGARVLRDRMPRTWAVFLAGSTSERCALAAAAAVEGLGAEHLPAFDAVAARMVPEMKPHEIARELGVLRDKLDPDAALPRHKTATNRRWVSARPAEDGMGVLQIRSTAIDVAAAYDRIRRRAVAAHGREDECRTLGQLMVDGAIDAILTGVMRGPDQGGPSYPMERIGSTEQPDRTVIDATVMVVIPAETATGASDVPGEVAGMGSIDGEVARHVVQHTRTWTRAVIDPVDDAVIAIDSHERYIPAGLKKLIHLRARTCQGDGCGLPAHRCDLDHVTRYEHDGRSRHDNLQVLCRRSHLGKDDGCHDVRMTAEGETRWRNKWGGVRIVKPVMKVRTAVYPDQCPF